MNAAQVLQAARAADIQVKIDGADLLLRASAPPPAAVLDLLSRHKGEVVALLRPGRNGWSAEDACRHRRVRWRTTACGSPGPCLGLLRRRMAEP
jgi:hypothetical protein